MSLVTHFNICQSVDCRTLVFTETTGVYGVSSNPTGYGTPNPSFDTATAATLVITAPGGAEYTIDLFTEGFPTNNPLTQFAITADLIGGIPNAPIPDGIYTFLYTEVNGSTYLQTVVQAFTCQVECCVYSMFKDLDITCDCAQEQKLKALDAFMLLKGLQTSCNCGNVANFNNDLAVLQKLCLNIGCKACK